LPYTTKSFLFPLIFKQVLPPFLTISPRLCSVFRLQSIPYFPSVVIPHPNPFCRSAFPLFSTLLIKLFRQFPVTPNLDGPFCDPTPELTSLSCLTSTLTPRPENPFLLTKFFPSYTTTPTVSQVPCNYFSTRALRPFFDWLPLPTNLFSVTFPPFRYHFFFFQFLKFSELYLSSSINNTCPLFPSPT